MHAQEINLLPVQKLSSDTIRVERLMPGPIERLWSYLVDEDKRRLWFAAGAMGPQVGSKTRLLFNHANFADEPTPEKYKEMDKGTMGFEVEVTVFEPPHRLSYTWPAAPGLSEVTFDLAEQGDKVLLVLTHQRLRDAGQMLNVSSGWHAHLQVLEDLLNNRSTKGFWSNIERLEKDYAQRFGGSAPASDRPGA
ncbi:SRPBCC family protein [Tianweitania sediminis]|uniref:SRPBCC family protein n=1 Tax=Tianweitania sediminis TaxID=1502156 RepID=A0A8J7R3L0_9HYPH|nr:SRPBCC family protein [Tianweitania sediminis]MBP0441137.1 SRPBCC family protein [Tianweitania sediminis]